MALRQWALALAAVSSLGLAACQRGADSGATANSNAPGSPGTGNPTEVARPQAADSSSGRGSAGAQGSMPHPGSSGGDGVAGASGSGTNAMGGPGTGLAGGLNPAPGQPTGVADGAKNSTQKDNVGKRY